MHHPRPQHPPSSRPYLYTGLVDSHLSSRNASSNIRDSRQVPSEEARSAQRNVKPQHPTMSVHPPVPPAIETSEKEDYHGFQVSAARLPPGSPTFALRRVTAPFSHIEYPNISPAKSQISDDYDSESHKSMAMAYDDLSTGGRSHSERRPGYGTTALGFRYSEPQRSQNPAAHSYQAPSERSLGEEHSFRETGQQVELMSTVRPPARRRVRGDSNSSIASIWSNIAVAGDPAYRNDMFLDDRNTSRHAGAQTSPSQPSGRFLPHSAPATYSYDYALGVNSDRHVSAMDVVSQGNFPSSPAIGMDVDPPMIIPPAPRPSELELADPDSPFTYQGAHWDVSNGVFSMASTDADAASLHSQDRPSSRDSIDPIGGGRRSRKATPEQRKPNVDGRKKTTMACHFCRYRKLRCDGGHPCTHCIHREKECTYDATIRRRGPGRKNKSAQETARVQLANRLREEVVREASVQKEVQKSQGRATRSKVEKQETHKDAWSQTSPQASNFPVSFSSTKTSVYSADVGSRPQFPTPEDSPTGRHEYQPLSTPFGYTHEGEPGTSGTIQALTHTSPVVRQYQLEGHRRLASGPLAPGLQTPVSQASSSFYDGSPGRITSQHVYYPPSTAGHASNRYSIATTSGETTYSHTDSESGYAYSEGANVLPYGYQQDQCNSRDQRHIQSRFRQNTGISQYPKEGIGMTMKAYDDDRATMEKYDARR
ncbi:hypothetical protein RHS02_00853, partial [Rhizoctonia solani]